MEMEMVAQEGNAHEAGSGKSKDQTGGRGSVAETVQVKTERPAT